MVVITLVLEDHLPLLLRIRLYRAGQGYFYLHLSIKKGYAKVQIQSAMVHWQQT